MPKISFLQTFEGRFILSFFCFYAGRKSVILAVLLFWGTGGGGGVPGSTCPTTAVKLGRLFMLPPARQLLPNASCALCPCCSSQPPCSKLGDRMRPFLLGQRRKRGSLQTMLLEAMKCPSYQVWCAVNIMLLVCYWCRLTGLLVYAIFPIYFPLESAKFRLHPSKKKKTRILMLFFVDKFHPICWKNVC